MPPLNKLDAYPIEEACFVYTVRPAAPGAARPPAITMWIVVTDPFCANPKKIGAVALSDEYEKADDFFFAGSSTRVISYLPGRAESDEYGSGFAWEDYDDKDFTQPPALFHLSGRNLDWYRTFDSAKIALFARCLALAEAEIENLKKPRREKTSDVERAA